MPIYKSEFPIMEYDSNPRAILEPGFQVDLKNYPKRAVYAFLEDECEQYALRHQCKQIGVYKTVTRDFPIYITQVNGKDVCFCSGHLGGSGAVSALDFLYACGVETVVATGSCGVLEQMEENELLIPVRALRDEGASYHYLPPSRTVGTNSEVNKAIAATLEKHGLKYKYVQTWTTDGFFRETADMVEYRKAEGCNVVDMECASMAACAMFRGKAFGELFFTADSLANADAYDERDWGKDSYEIAFILALEAAAVL